MFGALKGLGGQCFVNVHRLGDGVGFFCDEDRGEE